MSVVHRTESHCYCSSNAQEKNEFDKTYLYGTYRGDKDLKRERDVVIERGWP